jgi:hypothetical protein
MPIPTVTPYGGTIPNKATQTPTQFADAVYPFHLYYNATFVPQLQTTTQAIDQTVVVMNGIQTQTSVNASNASASATLANNYASEAYSSKISAETAYSNTVSLLSTLVIPAEATYSYEEIDEKIASGVLIYGMAYGFGHKSEVVLSEREALNKQLHDSFVINYTLGV